MSTPPGVLRGAIGALADELKRLAGARLAVHPEDQLKGPVRAVLGAAGQAFAVPVESFTEVRLDEVSARPDVGVLAHHLLCGHIELKAPGKGARPETFRFSDKQQWEKFKSLPNLIYTDGSEWALYRTGERQEKVIRLGDDLATAGSKGLEPVSIADLEKLLRDFLTWQPVVPSSPRALAETLAPLCHFLREEVLQALVDPTSAVARVAVDWRQALFPTADDPQFADAYAQTITYALLLARLEGDDRVRTDSAEAVLRRRHGLLAQALRILADPQARREIELGVSLLERVIREVDAGALRKKGADPWLYFYEDFLAKYDPRLRNARGVYYTPAEVIQAQCTLVAQLLTGDRFGKTLGFAADGVVLLDPAAGTGAYLLRALQMGLDRVRERLGAGAEAGRATEMAKTINGFELLVGPYAVAHLRVTQALLDAGGELPDDGVHVYLADTLESPHAETLGRLPLSHQPLADEHRRAQRIKAQVPVLVCMGNPPYDRQTIEREDVTTERKGGWVRFGEHGDDAILNHFLDPAINTGAGRHLKNLYNDYVYFWRWALWKVFEEKKTATGEVVQPAAPGIVSFISASSYLRGPGFVGMRKVMRETFDELWIIDLEGGQRGARKTENVFVIRSPVAIAVGVRYSLPRPGSPAKVWYSRVEGSREAKLRQLGAIQSFESLEWRECFDGWMQPFLPKGEGDYFSWPLLTDVFPWQQPGVKAGRTWCIGPSQDILARRWHVLCDSSTHERATLFKDSPTGRKTATAAPDTLPQPKEQISIADLEPHSRAPDAMRFAFRSLDRQWILADARVIDRPAASLWRVKSKHQVYLTSLLSDVLGLGPGAFVSAHVPDLHHFSGRGAKDVIALYRDAAAREPNITSGVLELLATAYGAPVSPEDLFAYAYAILASPAYVERFSEELTIPGLRLPLTRNPKLFRNAAELGRTLVFLHSHGERMAPPGTKGVPPGKTRCVKGIPTRPDAYPERYSYNPGTKTLAVGQGEFAPVAPEVFEFSVSGLDVVKSWLAYRMKEGAGRRSSPLDDIRPERWTAEMTEELLDLLWVLERTVALFPALAANLDAIVGGPLFSAAELPRPGQEQRQAPKSRGETEEPVLPYESGAR